MFKYIAILGLLIPTLVLGNITPDNTQEAISKGIEAANRSSEKFRGELIVIVDMTAPSYSERLLVVNRNTRDILVRTVVSHGIGSGKGDWAFKFSNKPGSYASSLGLYITQETYIGKYGYSLRLNGLEKGTNDNVRARNIVIHPAAYMSYAFLKDRGSYGNSRGCLALDPEISDKLIGLIKDGTPIYVYGGN